MMNFSQIPDVSISWKITLCKINSSIVSGIIIWPWYKKLFLGEMKLFFSKGEFTLENAQKVLMRDDFPEKLIPIREKLFEILA